MSAWMSHGALQGRRVRGEPDEIAAQGEWRGDSLDHQAGTSRRILMVAVGPDRRALVHLAGRQRRPRATTPEPPLHTAAEEINQRDQHAEPNNS
jgi:hypothetical protein